MGKDHATTPLMRQYHEIKKQYQDAVLFFRMGDFYEMFYEDAKIASEVLGLALTSRAHGKSASVPLAGFPYHALDTYLAKMVKAGYRVAICEQVEDPKKAKIVVKRAVTEVVTPGTALSEELLDSRRNNYLCAIVFENKRVGIATLDVSTGEFRVGEYPMEDVQNQLALIQPAEIVISEEQVNTLRDRWRLPSSIVITPKEGWIFQRDFGYEKLTQHFQTLTLKGFGVEDMQAGIAAAGAALYYAKENQQSDLKHISRLVRDEESTYLSLDAATQRNLELTHSLRGERKGTLLSVLDHTLTAMGARLLVKWIQRPLRQVNEINLRLDAVEELVNKGELLGELGEQLRGIGDIERLITRVTTQRANARDLNTLCAALERIQPIREQLLHAEAQLLRDIAEALNPLPDLVRDIRAALVDDPPLSITDGGIIRKGYHEELDRLRQIAYSGKDWILQLQESERQKTGIPSLKVRYNKVFGYYIEVTKPNLARVPEHYIRKQTLVNAERFITPELKEYEEQILSAEEKMVALEYELFTQMREHVAMHGQAVQINAQRLAELDCLCNFARIARERQYCRPQLSEEEAIHIEEGRHPVIERLLPFGEKFVPNDTHIANTDSQIQIITGPNMAGKSTYLRQVGLIVLMAQMGSFVPARSAVIGVVDKIFTRVGASDNLAGGESTFLVEMNETANILNNATPRSLILLDEIGRGTSTFDGLAIAWAVVEYLHENAQVAAKTLFATHYHELTELEMIFPRVKNFNIAVKEWGDQIIFLRKIVEGGCDHSYGIQVAKLAGLPNTVINRAKEILTNLEQNALAANHVPKLAKKRGSGVRPQAALQLDFFARENHAVVKELQQLDLDNMTPLQAFQKLIELKQKVDET
ncbi:MAG: DNA mismatch repair protein MutS [candidate division KSB1 bacterium]|nr:DNA mismatch repair protein MutS [candidate division KSB1 bacterium]